MSIELEIRHNREKMIGFYRKMYNSNNDRQVSSLTSPRIRRLYYTIYICNDCF